MRTLLGLAVAVFTGVLAFAHGAAAGPDAPPAGAVFKNPALGLELQAPSGWKMEAAKDVVVSWTRLATFTDGTTGAEAVLNVRERKSATIEALRDAAHAEFAAEGYTVNSIQIQPAAPGQDHLAVLVEATQLVAPPAPPPGKPGTPAPPAPSPATWMVSATYWLTPGYEFQLLARSRSTTWARVRTGVDAMRASFKVAGKASGPVGEGAFQHEALGLSCRLPAGYGVRIPRIKGQVAEFRGTSGDAPVLGIFHFTADFPLENDAQGLVKHYADQGGEATTSPLEVGGRPGLLVVARATVDGKPTTVYLAVTKRGDSDFFRIRAAVPQAAEAKGRAVFDAFLATLQIGSGAR